LVVLTSSRKDQFSEKQLSEKQIPHPAKCAGIRDDNHLCGGPEDGRSIEPGGFEWDKDEEAGMTIV